MSTYNLKPKFQNLLRPLTVVLFRLGITPNFVTVLTCFLSILVGLFLFFNKNHKYFFILPVFLFIRMALNAIDGMLAKEFNLKTKIGAVLNEVTDVIADIFLYYSFTSFTFIEKNLVVGILFLALISEIVGLSALLNGNQRVYSGPSGKSDRALIFGIMGLLIAFNIVNGLVYNSFLTMTLILLLVTIINRMKKAAL